VVKITLTARRLILPVRAVCQLNLAFFGVKSAAARGAFATEQTVDNGCGAADTCLHSDGLRWAVLSASSTLHAGVTIIDSSLAVIQAEHAMGANQGAHATADAFCLSELKGDHVLKVDESPQ